MKAFVACFAAAVFCFLALVRGAIAQDENKFCSGPFNICGSGICTAGSGNCPDVPSMPYKGYIQSFNMLITTCASGFGTCDLQPDPVVACNYNYYTVRNYLGQCSNQCGTGTLAVYVCPLQ